MEFMKPTTGTGQELHSILKKWKRQSPKKSTNFLKRILFMYASKVINQDAFISALYGQKVLKQRPRLFMKKFSSKVFGVQHAIELCLKTEKSSLKKLIVALEWSENVIVLAEVFNRVDQAVLKTQMENSGLKTENNSVTSETVSRIKTEAPENSEDVIIVDELGSSLPQAQAEAPQEIPAGDGSETPAPEARSSPYQCRFKGCGIGCWTRGELTEHHKSHDGQCGNCGETDARMMTFSYLKKCCNKPHIFGGPFYCLGHCEEFFDTCNQRWTHMRGITRTCHKCGGRSSWLAKHHC